MRGLWWAYLSERMNNPQLSDIADRDIACVHASCVAVGDRCVLILGASGAGKSALALQMMAMGAQLVSDDRVELRIQDGQVIAQSPAAIRGLIEARGIGLLQAETADQIPLYYVVDLDEPETERLPAETRIRVLRQTVPLLRGAGIANLPAALIQLLKMGRVNPEWPSN